MGETLRIYRALVAARVRSQLEYRMSFALTLVGTTLVSFMDFVEILVLFHNVPVLKGWSLAEVGFFYGIASAVFAVSDMVFGHLDKLHLAIKSGDFDLVLIRPLGSLFQAISGDFALRRLGRVFQAAAVLGVSIAALDLRWTPAKVGMMVVMVAAGAVIFSSIWVAGAAVTFWTTETMEVTNAFTYGGSLLTSYPLNIYGTWLRRLLAFVIPLGFVNYFPSLYILDRPDPLGLPSFLRFLGVPVAVVTALAATTFWRFAVRHYRSTGS